MTWHSRIACITDVNMTTGRFPSLQSCAPVLLCFYYQILCDFTDFPCPTANFPYANFHDWKMFHMSNSLCRHIEFLRKMLGNHRANIAISLIFRIRKFPVFKKKKSCVFIIIKDILFIIIPNSLCFPLQFSLPSSCFSDGEGTLFLSCKTNEQMG